MALTKAEHEELLRRIAESGGDTANMLDLMQKLRDDYDEREGMLRKYGETYDGENRDRREDRDRDRREDRDRDEIEDRRERRDRDRGDEIDWKERYAELDKRYRERFFSTPTEVIRENTEDIKRDGEKQTFEELFERREG